MAPLWMRGLSGRACGPRPGVGVRAAVPKGSPLCAVTWESGVLSATPSLFCCCVRGSGKPSPGPPAALCSFVPAVLAQIPKL